MITDASADCVREMVGQVPTPVEWLDVHLRNSDGEVGGDWRFFLLRYAALLEAQSVTALSLGPFERRLLTSTDRRAWA